MGNRRFNIYLWSLSGFWSTDSGQGSFCSVVEVLLGVLEVSDIHQAMSMLRLVVDSEANGSVSRVEMEGAGLSLFQAFETKISMSWVVSSIEKVMGLLTAVLFLLWTEGESMLLVGVSFGARPSWISEFTACCIFAACLCKSWSITFVAKVKSSGNAFTASQGGVIGNSFCCFFMIDSVNLLTVHKVGKRYEF